MTSKRRKHDPKTVTLAFCRRYVEKRIRRRQGVVCPCCHKPCKMRPGTISKPMLVALVKMYLKLESVKDLRETNGDYAKLRHWGLVEQIGKGRWRLTPRGREFLHGRVEVPKTAVTFNRRCYELTGRSVTVFDCYGSRAGFVAMVARVKDGANE
jgi:hypothetical protein